MLASERIPVPAHVQAYAILSTSLILIGYLYRDSFIYLFSLWNDMGEGDYSHGYVVILTSLYIIYLQHKSLATLPINPSIAGLVVILTSSLLWSASIVVDVMAVQGVALVFLLLGATWAILGTAYIKKLAFPILYLLFAVPIWTLLSPLLQTFVAEVVYILARQLDIPLLKEEHFLILPYGRLSIEEACSGLRYLLAATTLGIFYAYLNYSSIHARILVVAIAMITAIAGNVIRVLILVYLAHATDMEHPWIEDHLTLGWVLFAAMLFCLLIIDALFFRRRQPAQSNEQPTLTGSTASAGLKFGTLSYAILLGSLIFTATGPYLYNAYRVDQLANDGVNDTFQLPFSANGWIQTDDTNTQWKPVFLGAVETVTDYTKDGAFVRAYHGYYMNQTQGRELVNDLNSVAGKHPWSTIRTYATVIEDREGNRFLEQIIQTPRGGKRLVWYRYTVSGFDVIRDYSAKLYQVVGLFTGQYHADVLVMSVALDEEIDNSRSILSDFYSRVVVSTNTPLATY